MKKVASLHSHYKPFDTQVMDQQIQKKLKDELINHKLNTISAYHINKQNTPLQQKFEIKRMSKVKKLPLLYKKAREALKKEGHIMLLSQIYQKFDQKQKVQVKQNDDEWLRIKNEIYHSKKKKDEATEQDLHIMISNLQRQEIKLQNRMGKVLSQKKFANQKQFSKFIPSNKKVKQININIVSSLIRHIKKFDYKDLSCKIMQCCKFYQGQTNVIQKLLLQYQQEIKDKMAQYQSVIQNKYMENSDLNLKLKNIRSYQFIQRQSKNQLTLKMKTLERERVQNKEARLLQKKNAILQKLQLNKNIILQNQLLLKKQKRSLKNAKQSRIHLLKGILQMGYDVRQSGLSWIIKKLAQLQQPVQNTQLPKFLDEKAKMYLIQVVLCYQVSKMQIQIDQTNEKIKALVQSYRKKIQKYNKQQHRVISTFKANCFQKMDIRRIRRQNQQSFDYSDLSILNRNKSYSNNIKQMLYQLKSQKLSNNYLLYKEARQRIKTKLMQKDQKFSRKSSKIFGTELRQSTIISQEKLKTKEINEFKHLQQILSIRKKQKQKYMKMQKQRIIKQFSYRQYKGKAAPITVLCALFGPYVGQKQFRSNINLRQYKYDGQQ